MAKQGDHGIAWTEQTWNPIRGCSRVSEGCRNCYAERVAARFSGPGQPYEGLAILHHGEPRWTGKVRLVEEHLEDPLHWTKPRMIFVNSMSDLFHEALAEEDIVKVISVMIMALRKVNHVFQILTKRPERMRDILRKIDPMQMDTRMWWGVSIEDQKTANERIPMLLDTPAAIRWVSYEPALGPVDFRSSLRRGLQLPIPAWSGDGVEARGARIDWVVCGGESGFGARPMELWWARNALAQCDSAGVAFFMKQLSETGVYAKHHNYKSLNCFPEELRVREYPKVGGI